jgi:hypothetical protein
MAVLEIHESLDHFMHRSQVGYSRISLSLQLMDHAFEGCMSRPDLLLAKTGTLLQIATDIAHFLPP